jgi:transposase-like protein
MLSGMRKTYDAAFKAKVALEAAKGEKTIAQIAGEYSVHPNQIRLWRNHLMEQLPELFSRRRPQQEKALEEREAELYEEIGRLKMELEWLKKKSQTLLSR